HGGLLHIIFNVLWIRQLGPKVEEYYGPARLVVVFSVSGVLGFVVSNAFDVPFTVGASGSIFGLLGALVAYGRKRGGGFGRFEPPQYCQGGFGLLIAGVLMSGGSNLSPGAGACSCLRRGAR